MMPHKPNGHQELRELHEAISSAKRTTADCKRKLEDAGIHVKEPEPAEIKHPDPHDTPPPDLRRPGKPLMLFVCAAALVVTIALTQILRH